MLKYYFQVRRNQARAGMVEWNRIFRLFRFSGILGQPREVHPKFRNEIPENVCSISSPSRNFQNFWSNGKRPLSPQLLGFTVDVKFVMNFLKGVVSICHSFRNTGQPGRINGFDRCFQVVYRCTARRHRVTPVLAKTQILKFYQPHMHRETKAENIYHCPNVCESSKKSQVQAELYSQKIYP